MNDHHYELAGWLLFTGSALAFLLDTVQAGDPVGIAASLLFLAGCVAFLIPLLRR